MVVELAVVEQQHVEAVGEDAGVVEAAGAVAVVAGAEKTIMMFNTFIYFYFWLIDLLNLSNFCTWSHQTANRNSYFMIGLLVVKQISFPSELFLPSFTHSCFKLSQCTIYKPMSS